MYLSKNIYGSAQHGPALISSHSPQDKNFFISYRKSAIANVTLVAGRSYYI